MDVPVTLLTVTVVYALVKWLNSLFPNGIPSPLKVPLAVAIGIGVAFVMRESDFAPVQQFFNKPLNQMNSWSVVVVGLMLALGAVGLDTTFKTIRNVGENDSTT